MSTLAFWVASAAVAAAEAAIVITALRMKVAPDAGRGLLGTRPLEVLWTLLPVALVVLLLAVSYAEVDKT